MKIFIVTLFISLSSIVLLSQNLIPNPGFDDLSDCPTAFGQINLAAPWVSASNGTPDLYNTCSAISGFDTPPYTGTCIKSYQQIKSKTGYAAIICYNNDNVPVSEYIGTELTKKLEKGKLYYIRFYISPDNAAPCDIGFTDAIGLAFTKAPYYKVLGKHEVLPLSPAIENRNVFITDTAGWTQISGCYKAKGNEAFAIIGNFRNKDETKILFEHGEVTPFSNYAYIEDVTVAEFDPLPDTILMCGEETLKLNASFLEATYKWSTGQTDSVITINKPGKYTVEALLEGCTFADEVIVLSGTQDQINFTDITICDDELFSISAPLPGDYIWNDGSTSQSIDIANPGDYSVTITNKCGTYEYNTNVKSINCDCEINIPNIFSPNGDGFNDELSISYDCDLTISVNSFSIFDRWGNTVFKSVKENFPIWDGRYKNEKLSSGVYIWLLDYNITKKGEVENIVIGGDVTILR